MKAALKQVSSFADKQSARAEDALRAKIQADDLTPAKSLYSLTQTVRENYAARFQDFVRVDSSTGAFSVFFPDPGDPRADCICVTNVGTSYNDVSIRPMRTDFLVGGLATYSLGWPGDSVWFYPDAQSRNWIAVDQHPAGVVRVLDNRYSPVGNWPLNVQSLNDASGNGNALTLEAGSLQWTYVAPYCGGFYFGGDTRLVVAAFTAGLALTGDMTLMGIVNLDARTLLAPTNSEVIISHAAAGAGGANNDLYALALERNNQIDFFSESGGGGVISSWSVNSWVSRGITCMFYLTRTGNVIQHGLQGRTWGTASAALITPTGGANGRFRLGGFPGAGAGLNFHGSMASVCVYDRALTAAELAERFRFSFSPPQGYI